MWKKSEPEISSPTIPQKRPTPARSEGATARKARIGAGIVLKGELRGDEDVIIEGRVEGTITLERHGVIVEESGHVEADVTANTICVAGKVVGNLHGAEQVVLLKTGRVQGDIFSKSVTLETGAQFNGSVDMEMVEAPSSVTTYETAEAASKANGSTHVAAS